MPSRPIRGRSSPRWATRSSPPRISSRFPSPSRIRHRICASWTSGGSGRYPTRTASLSEIPMIVLSGRHGVSGRRPAGRRRHARGPAGLHEIYRLIQQIARGQRPARRRGSRPTSPRACRMRRARNGAPSGALALRERLPAAQSPEPLMPLGSQIEISASICRRAGIHRDPRRNPPISCFRTLGLIFHRDRSGLSPRHRRLRQADSRRPLGLRASPAATRLSSPPP